jgi:hypothetical protein
MRILGHLRRDGRHWLADMPALDGMTQGRSRAEAVRMAADWAESLIGRTGVHVTAEAGTGDAFHIRCTDAAALVGLLLRRRREQAGLSLADVAHRLGASSRNAYARYEQGGAMPSVTKLDELLAAVAPDHDLLVGV